MKWTWIDPSGGMRYHLTGILNHKQWQADNVHVKEWLKRVFQKAFAEKGITEVIWFGPSASYWFPLDVFLNFSHLKILLIDWDPVARFVFDKIHKHTLKQLKDQHIEIEWKKANFWKVDLKQSLELPNPKQLMIFNTIFSQLENYVEQHELEVDALVQSLNAKEILANNIQVHWLHIEDLWVDTPEGRYFFEMQKKFKFLNFIQSSMETDWHLRPTQLHRMRLSINFI